jgi:sugar phosphate permease
VKEGHGVRLSTAVALVNNSDRSDRLPSPLRAGRWRVAILVSAAIAISYLDRQSLPVAGKAIQQEIPLSNTQFGDLTSLFLLADAVMYAGGGVLVDRSGHSARLFAIMIFWSLAPRPTRPLLPAAIGMVR